MTEPRKPVPRWKRALDLYLEGRSVERGLSQNTVDAYRNDLTRLGEALAKRGDRDLLTADAATLAAHQRELRRQGLSPRSINRALSAIRGFYESLVTTGERTDNPAVNCCRRSLCGRSPRCSPSPRSRRSSRRPTSRAPGAPRPRHARAAHATGLRLSDLVALRSRSSALDAGFLIAFAREQGARRAGGETAEMWVQRYLRDIRPGSPRGATSRCSVNHAGRPDELVGVWKNLKRYGLEAGVRDLSPHVVRHSFAPISRARRRPARRADHARPCRHLDDEIYTHIHQQRLKTLYDRFHPAFLGRDR